MWAVSLIAGAGFIVCSYLWVMFLASQVMRMKWWGIARGDARLLGIVLLLYVVGWAALWLIRG